MGVLALAGLRNWNSDQCIRWSVSAVGNAESAVCNVDSRDTSQMVQLTAAGELRFMHRSRRDQCIGVGVGGGNVAVKACGALAGAPQWRRRNQHSPLEFKLLDAATQATWAQ